MDQETRSRAPGSHSSTDFSRTANAKRRDLFVLDALDGDGNPTSALQVKTARGAGESGVRRFEVDTPE